MKKKTALQIAAWLVGSHKELAENLGVTLQAMGHWKTRGIPIKWCLEIEKQTGGKVTRRHLRPDDWQSIWPELKRKTPATDKAKA